MPTCADFWSELHDCGVPDYYFENMQNMPHLQEICAASSQNPSHYNPKGFPPNMQSPSPFTSTGILPGTPRNDGMSSSSPGMPSNNGVGSPFVSPSPSNSPKNGVSPSPPYSGDSQYDGKSSGNLPASPLNPYSTDMFGGRNPDGMNPGTGDNPYNTNGYPNKGVQSPPPYSTSVTPPNNGSGLPFGSPSPSSSPKNGVSPSPPYSRDSQYDGTSSGNLPASPLNPYSTDMFGGSNLDGTNPGTGGNPYNTNGYPNSGDSSGVPSPSPYSPTGTPYRMPSNNGAGSPFGPSSQNNSPKIGAPSPPPYSVDSSYGGPSSGSPLVSPMNPYGNSDSSSNPSSSPYSSPTNTSPRGLSSPPQYCPDGPYSGPPASNPATLSVSNPKGPSSGSGNPLYDTNLPNMQSPQSYFPTNSGMPLNNGSSNSPQYLNGPSYGASSSPSDFSKNPSGTYPGPGSYPSNTNSQFPEQEWGNLLNSSPSNTGNGNSLGPGFQPPYGFDGSTSSSQPNFSSGSSLYGSNKGPYANGGPPPPGGNSMPTKNSNPTSPSPYSPLFTPSSPQNNNGATPGFTIAAQDPQFQNVTPKNYKPAFMNNNNSLLSSPSSSGSSQDSFRPTSSSQIYQDNFSSMSNKQVSNSDGSTGQDEDSATSEFTYSESSFQNVQYSKTTTTDDN